MKASHKDGRAAAFFDLDRTLIDVNSAVLYARDEYKDGRISLRQLLQSGVWSVLYHMSLLNMQSAYAKAAKHYAGMSSTELSESSAGWFKRSIVSRLQPGARRALDQHRSEGEPLVLLTNTSSFLAEAATAEFGLDAWLANIFPVDDRGRLTGTMEQPLCYGDGKVTRASAWAHGNGIDLGASTFYTDSLSDVPMLECVGHPRVVNPDPRLRRLARRRGWPILDWSQPS